MSNGSLASATRERRTSIRSIIPRRSGSNTTQQFNLAKLKSGIKKEEKLDPEVADFELRQAVKKKAIEDAFSTRRALDLVSQFRDRYVNVMSPILQEGGVSGQFASGRRFLKGVVLKNNPEMSSLFRNLKSLRPFLARTFGDRGNLSIVEQEAAGENVPLMAFNTDPLNLFLPDDPKTAVTKLDNMIGLLMKGLETANNVIETGAPTDSYIEWVNRGGAQNKLNSIQDSDQNRIQIESRKQALRNRFLRGRNG